LFYFLPFQAQHLIQQLRQIPFVYWWQTITIFEDRGIEMKLKLLTLTLAMVFVSSMAFAQTDEDNDLLDVKHAELVDTENEELPEASMKLIKELKAECKEYAVEDAVPEETLNQYLLECVNADLDSGGYRMLKKLP
jgi:hypothetical protein